MNSRERFLETMRYGSPDRVPYFEEGIRREVLREWRKQGLPRDANIAQIFPSDRREVIEPDLEPSPKFKKWPTSRAELKGLRQRLDPYGRGRLPRGWSQRVRRWQKRDHVLMLRIHRGFFLTMGVYDWRRFAELMDLLIDDPEFVREAMTIQGKFAAGLAERVLKDVVVDAALFSEPIGGNYGPLISPQMYEEMVLRSYEPVLDVLHKYKVETIVLVTYANARALIPSMLKWGFNCLWACEVNIEEMDYRNIRQEFGRELRLIGGIDLDALRRDKDTIRSEIEEKVPPLVADGGYVPLADGRVRSDVPYENYVYYRELLQKVTQM
jgi:uroporphyrinogen decarboxylase